MCLLTPTKEGPLFSPTEPKMQGWRALAIFADNTECLIYLGGSTTQVRDGYAAAYEEVLDAEERAQVRSISLQCWHGTPAAGRWVSQVPLAIPVREPMPARRSAADPKSIRRKAARPCAVPTA